MMKLMLTRYSADAVREYESLCCKRHGDEYSFNAVLQHKAEYQSERAGKIAINVIGVKIKLCHVA
jgi:hypothetical protein